MAVATERLEAAGIPVRETRADSGFWGWISTVDHKRIGILYLGMGIVFLAVAGLYALIMRFQTMQPLKSAVTGDLYNQFLTIHGTTMIFFAATPIVWGLFNYVMPVMIGARDVAFPRLNMVSFWLTLAGGIILTSSWFFDGAPSAGWFVYTPLSSQKYSPGMGMDAYLVGVMLGMVGTLLTTVNFTVTILTLRAPGMSLMKMPAFPWFALCSSIIAIGAGIPFMVGMLFLMFDRWFGTSFFVPQAGGDVLLWQHLFWMFGHPEVYVLVVPAFGVISEVLPAFARKPLFGYRSVVAALFSIFVISFVVWVHHMHTVGMGAVANIAFMISTKAVSVPTAMLFFSWLATIWGGQLRFALPVYYAVAFLAQFLIGGLTGMVNASSSAMRQVEDNMWIVAHFHYVAVGGIVFALLAGLIYWWPKITGRMLNEGLGKLSFWLTFAGFNLTFAPLFLAGLGGMPRRQYTYLPEQGWSGLNGLSAVGSWVLALGIVVLVVMLLESLLRGPKAPADAWGEGRTLEWAVPSPVPAYNFARLPLVRGREALWTEKMEGDGRIQPAPGELDEGRHGDYVHMPSPSLMPAVVGLGSLIAGFGGVLRSPGLAILGFLIIAVGALGWAWEDYRGYYLKVEGGEAA